MVTPLTKTSRDPLAEEPKEYIKLPKKKRKPILCFFNKHRKIADIMPGYHITNRRGTVSHVYECEGCGQGFEIFEASGRVVKLSKNELAKYKDMKSDKEK